MDILNQMLIFMTVLDSSIKYLRSFAIVETYTHLNCSVMVLGLLYSKASHRIRQWIDLIFYCHTNICIVFDTRSDVSKVNSALITAR